MIEVMPATPKDIVYIDSLQRKNADALAFYPRAVFEREIPAGRIVLARANNDPVGYLYHGALGERLKIHQACIQYDARGVLFGSALVRWLEQLARAGGVHSINLRCGSDLLANKFWSAMGFHCEAVMPGGVRRMRDINAWKLDLQPDLFAQSIAPSDKAQDASIWRKHKSGSNSQFMRGKQMREYRAAILARAAG